MKKLKFKIKGWLLVKLAKARRETRVYKEKLSQEILKQQDYVDKISLMQNDIRQLLLKLDDDVRADWLKEKGKEYAGYFYKEKSAKKKINSTKNNKI